jgi:UDP-N-acetylglucosamine 2-epimerase (non-hydrolysing)
MRAVCVVGTRPNFMKMKPVIDALEERGVETFLVHTGQHYDDEMSGVFFGDIGLRMPDVDLRVGSGTHAQQTAGVMLAFEPVLRETAPDVVVVVGDVNSTVACALVAAKAGPRVGHVEAGLRSRDWTMPEEVNRVATDRISDVLLAPSPDAVANLRREGRSDEVHLVGNVMIDTLMANLPRARERRVVAGLSVGEEPFALLTLHRPATVDDETIMRKVVGAIRDLSKHVPVVFPVHPRTREGLSGANLGNRVTVTGPLGYLDFVALESAAKVVLTDSGGVQEETTVLGVPCLTLRDATERPITVSNGTNVVVGTEPARILSEAERALAGSWKRARPALWDGCAGTRIAKALVAAVSDKSYPRPTGFPRGLEHEEGVA